MSDADLLRMLEPIVRPGNLPGRAQSAPPPVEQQDFATLLAEIGGRENPMPQPTQDAAADPPPETARTHPLAGLEKIENASLRRLIAQPRQPGASPTSQE